MDELQTRGENAITAGFSAALFADFIDFIDRPGRTTQTYLTNLRQFMAWLKYAGITQPTREDIKAYRTYLLSEHEAIMLDPAAPAGFSYRLDNAGNRQTTRCKPTTAAQYINSVRQFFAWAAANGLYPNIAAGIHAPAVNAAAHKKEALEPGDVYKIEQTIDRSTEQGKRLYAMFTLAVNAGLRTIELSRANIKDLELKNGVACIYVYGKGHSDADYKKPIAREVYDALQDYIKARTDRPTSSSPLFVATGNRSGGQRIEARTISQMLKRAMIDAGYNSERLTAHSLRHTTAQTALDITGRNIYKTQMYMRHQSPHTTEIYLRETPEDIKAQAEMAADIYRAYHNTGVADDPGIAAILDKLTPEQVKQLTEYAAGLAI